jgi:hypothetical protein
MAYVGQGIKGGTFSVLDTSGNTYNGSNVTFDLGTHVSSPAQLLVSHDGVIQKPVTDYTLASGGTQITFTTAPASGASIFITEISGAVGAPMNRDINGDELILDADADTSITADTDDQIDVRIAGADDFTITANKFDALAGSNIHVSGDADADDITGDSAQGRVTLGAGQDLNLYHGGTNSYIVNDTGDLVINTGTSDSDIVFSGNDGGSAITAMTIDMSNAGILNIKSGIGFPATQVASSGANVLDDYEEGTWTPDITDGTNAMSIDVANGYYTKIGNRVYCNGAVGSSGLGSASGAIRLAGLPFTASSSSNAFGGGSCVYGVGLNITASMNVNLRVETGAAYAMFALWDVTTGTSNMSAAEWSADGNVRFYLSYMV